jgi:hypothetical protein
MGLLRRLGVVVDGEGYHEHFCWLVELDNEVVVIHRPQD